MIEFADGPYPAYAWSFPVADGGANVGYGVFDRRGAGNRQEFLDALRRLLPGQEPHPATIRAHHLPLSTGPRFHPDGRVLLAGDAASMVNPLTGEGIFDAVASGVLAGRAALRRRRSRRAAPTCNAALLRTSPPAQRGDVAAVADPRFLDAAVSAASRHGRVFDAAVDLGLGRGTVPVAALVRVIGAYVGGGLSTCELRTPHR